MALDDGVLFARIGGATWRQIGQRFRISHEGSRYVYRRAREAYLDALVAGVEKRRGTKDWELAIPPPFRDDPDAAARYVGWVIGALVERGVHITCARFGTTLNDQKGLASAHGGHR